MRFITLDGNRPLMEEVEALLSRLLEAGLEFDLLVREAMLNVDVRHFSTESPEPFYHDRPLVFLETDRGGVKTISAPHMVVTMLHHLELAPGMQVMLIGAKAGYLAALISEIVGEEGGVTLLDPDEEVLKHVTTSLRHSGHGEHVQVRKLRRDGRAPANLPDELSRVLVTGALRDLPAWVEKRIADSGFAIFPMGGKLSQRLIKRERQGEDCFDTELGNVVFGPLDIQDSEPQLPGPAELADMMEDVSSMALELGLLKEEDIARVHQLVEDLRSLPEDLPPFIPFEQYRTGTHPVEELLEDAQGWLSGLWPLFLMMSDIRIQHPGSLEEEEDEDDEDDADPYRDLIP